MGKPNNVEELLKRSPNTELSTHLGETAWSLASKSKNTQITKLFEKYRVLLEEKSTLKLS